MIVLLDNYDSFTYNLAQYLGELGVQVNVIRNDVTTVEAIADMAPEAIVISPGPCTPQKAGISIDLVRRLGREIPILGVCLGHQAIGTAYGARIIRAPVLMHGKTSPIHHQGDALFQGLPDPFEAGRYHSLIIDENSLPDELQVTARDPDGVIMAVRHRSKPVQGIQFHPESILTPDGKQLIKNFLGGLEA